MKKKEFQDLLALIADADPLSMAEGHRLINLILEEEYGKAITIFKGIKLARPELIPEHTA